MGAGLERKREVGRGGEGGGGGDGSDSLCDGIDLTPPLGHPAATLTLPQSLTSDPMTPPFSPPQWKCTDRKTFPRRLLTVTFLHWVDVSMCWGGHRQPSIGRLNDL